MSVSKGNNKSGSRLSMFSILCLYRQLMSDYPDTRNLKSMLLGFKENKNKKQYNKKQKNKRKTRMKILKNLKLIIFPSIFVAVLIMGLTLKNQQVTDKNQLVIYVNPGKQNLEGSSEFFYTPEGDSRLWHVKNLYSSGNSGNSGLSNNSEYIFTKDYVEVVNNYVGVSSVEFFANK
jgi:hypothetical protein